MATINVKQWGDNRNNAKGDGVTDDTVAIRAAIAHINALPKTEPHAIFFPAGTYLVTDQLSVTGERITFHGEPSNPTVFSEDGRRVIGSSSSVIKLKGKGRRAGFLLRRGWKESKNGQKERMPEIRNISFSDLSFSCGEQDPQYHEAAIYAINVNNLSLKSIVILGVKGPFGVRISSREMMQSRGCRLDHVFVSGEKGTEDKGLQAGIKLDAELKDAAGKTLDPNTVWKASVGQGASEEGKAATSAYPVASNLISHCHVRDAYYGLSFSAVRDTEVRECSFAQNVRGISIQDGSSLNRVIGNRIIDNDSAGIHLAYGASDNRIVGNSIESSRAKGEGFLQAYVGSKRNVFDGNSLCFTGTGEGADAKDTVGPRYFLYAGVHADGNVFSNNVVVGCCDRAYAAVESAWNTGVTGDHASLHYAFNAKSQYANDMTGSRGVSGCHFIGNTFVPVLRAGHGAPANPARRPFCIFFSSEVDGRPLRNIRFIGNRVLWQGRFGPATEADRDVNWKTTLIKKKDKR